MTNRRFWIIILIITNLVTLGVIGWLAMQRTEPQTAVSEATAPAAAVSLSSATPTASSPQVTETSVPPPTPTNTAPTATPLPTAVPPTATPIPPTATPLPPTATPLPPTPEPTATAVALLGPDWLNYINLFRDMAALPNLANLEPLSSGSNFHSQYMVLNDKPIAHSEDPANNLYTDIGDQAARHGNIFATTQLEATYQWSINFWISAPFHLIPIIDPELAAVGFGIFNQEDGTYHTSAVLDVRSADKAAEIPVDYPIFFPGDGSETWILRQSLYEWPEPFGNCPGYGLPSGPALVLQIGDGSLTPQVTHHVLLQGDQTLESCVFDETNYVNANAYAQQQGRIILDERDAIVILPKNQLAVGETYTVQVTANGQTYTWSFSTRRRPPE